MPTPARVAFYTPGHLGDVLMTAPLLRAWKEQRGRDHVRWIVGPWARDIARRYKWIDEVATFSPAWVQYRRKRGGDSARAQVAWADLQQPVDVFISTARTELTTQFVGRALRPSWWVGRGLGAAFYPVATRQDSILPNGETHEIEDLMRLLTPFGLAAREFHTTFPITDEEQNYATKLCESVAVQSDGEYIALAPGAGWLGKQWPVERWATVADHLAEAGVSVVLIGASSERSLAQSVQNRMKRPALNLAGRTSIGELAALVKSAVLWLGSDSGGLHLAAAVGTPTISLFGPTNPAKWAPRGPGHRVIRSSAPCVDCIPWHPKADHRNALACMEAISVEEVVTAALSALAQFSSRSRE